jgi:cytochrome c peroxidase
MNILLLLFLTQLSFASDLDLKLQGYVKNFNLKPERSLPSKKGHLLTLGQRLFTTNLLSGNKNISCVHCHHPMVMTHDGLPLALGEGAQGISMNGGMRIQANGKILARNTPALFNLHGVQIMFWDGRISFDGKSFATPLEALNGPRPKRSDITSKMSSALAAQAIFPIVDHAEMRGQPGTNKIADAQDEFEAWDLVIEQLLESESISDLFSKAYPAQKINIGHVGEALAHFQTLAFGFIDTPYDRYLKGEVTALSDSQKRGMDVFFGKGRCGECHNGEKLSNFGFENIGVPQIGPGKSNGDDRGRQEVSSNAAPYSFRVPPLRNIALTAPYMHDGVFANLDEVLSHYENIRHSLHHFRLDKTYPNYVEKITDHDHKNDRVRLQNLSPRIRMMINLTDAEKEDLKDFLRYGLTDVRLHNRVPESEEKLTFGLF